MYKQLFHIFTLIFIISIIGVGAWYLTNEKAKAPHPDGTYTLINNAEIFGKTAAVLDNMVGYFFITAIVSLVALLCVFMLRRGSII